AAEVRRPLPGQVVNAHAAVATTDDRLVPRGAERSSAGGRRMWRRRAGGTAGTNVVQSSLAVLAGAEQAPAVRAEEDQPDGAVLKPQVLQVGATAQDAADADAVQRLPRRAGVEAQGLDEPEQGQGVVALVEGLAAVRDIQQDEAATTGLGVLLGGIQRVPQPGVVDQQAGHEGDHAQQTQPEQGGDGGLAAHPQAETLVSGCGAGFDGLALQPAVEVVGQGAGVLVALLRSFFQALQAD